MNDAATDRLADNREWRDRIVARLDEIEARLASIERRQRTAPPNRTRIVDTGSARLADWWPT